MDSELLYTIALTRLPALNLIHQHLLMDHLGSATAVFEHRHNLSDILPSAHRRLTEALSAMDSLLPRAEEELRFVHENHIRCLHINDEDYPARLRDCPDAPLILYYCGKADLNAPHIISMVGTRQATEYGRDLCRRFIHELRQLCPDTLIVSGLAYGVDICCHRAALQEEMPTVGVLAHGLDQIYPRMHRDTAAQMTHQGGLITEFMSRTNADKKNFVQRNRIVAGISDATIVVESAAKGGSLITADIAESYHRDVFAFPGRTTDPRSEGCNQLIRRNRAMLITSAQDFVEAMGWQTVEERRQLLTDGIQQELFPDLSDDERRIVEALSKADDMHINVLSVKTGLPAGLLTSLLFTLEMKGIVKIMSGGKYRLLPNVAVPQHFEQRAK